MISCGGLLHGGWDICLQQIPLLHGFLFLDIRVLMSLDFLGLLSMIVVFGFGGLWSCFVPE